MNKRILLIAGLALAPLVGQANVIDFDDLALPNYGAIPADYKSRSGDTPNVEVSYATVGYSTRLEFWNSGYGDLTKVGYADASGYLARVSLTPDPGYTVTLIAFDLAGWPGATQFGQTVRILDGSNAVLLDYSPWNITGFGHDTFLPNLTSGDTLTIEWGPSWNGGIDNIQFRQGIHAAVPDVGSSAALLLLSGCVGAAVFGRRR